MHAGELADPVPAQAKRTEATEEERSKIQHQFRGEGQEVNWRGTGARLHWKAE